MQNQNSSQRKQEVIEDAMQAMHRLSDSGTSSAAMASPPLSRRNSLSGLQRVNLSAEVKKGRSLSTLGPSPLTNKACDSDDEEADNPRPSFRPYVQPLTAQELLQRQSLASARQSFTRQVEEETTPGLGADEAQAGSRVKYSLRPSGTQPVPSRLLEAEADRASLPPRGLPRVTTLNRESFSRANRTSISGIPNSLSRGASPRTSTSGAPPSTPRRFASPSLNAEAQRALTDQGKGNPNVRPSRVPSIGGVGK